MRGKSIWLVIAVVLCGPATIWGQATDPPAINPAAGNPALSNPPASNPADPNNARLNQLEAETQALRSEVQWLREHPVRLPEVPATATAMQAETTSTAGVGPQQQYTLEELSGELQKYAWKKGDFSITPYGYLWGNMVYSTERTDPGSYTLFVQSPTATGVAESEFITDDRNTRLGLDFLGPKIPFFCNAQSGGRVEVDFQNTVLSTENKPTILLRHAYLEVKDDEERFLVGQTWDVISPLYPGMLLYTVGWDGGNIGYRRAQVRDERYFALSDTSLLIAQLSVNQDIFSDNSTNPTPAVAEITGKSSNWPLVEGRAAWKIGPRGPGCLPVEIGVSGHIGEQEFSEEFTSGAVSPDNRRRTWSGNIDLRWPLTERLGFQGECQMGENLSTFFGGIGQGIDPTTGGTIRDAGGWFEVWYDWTPRLHSHVGYSVDEPNQHDLRTFGERTYNQFYFGNLLYDFTKNFLVGVEVSSWKTLFIGEAEGDSVRSEFVAKYGF
jgi:hypothetical protein